MKWIFKPRPILRALRPWIIVCCFVLVCGTYQTFAQCSVPAGFVCIPQAAADKIAKDLDELKAARQSIAAFVNERAATDKEREAWKSFMSASDVAMNVLQKGIADREALVALQQKTLELYAVLVEKLTAQINKPKTGWQKFLATVEKIIVFAAGAAIGHGLP